MLLMRAGDKNVSVKTSSFPLLQNLQWDNVVLFGYKLV